MSLEGLIFLLLLIDAIGANWVAHFGGAWYAQNFQALARWFPPARGWTAYYLALVLWVGSLLYRAGALP